jgi:hypothetical protein
MSLKTIIKLLLLIFVSPFVILASAIFLGLLASNFVFMGSAISGYIAVSMAMGRMRKIFKEEQE